MKFSSAGSAHSLVGVNSRRTLRTPEIRQATPINRSTSGDCPSHVCFGKSQGTSIRFRRNSGCPIAHPSTTRAILRSSTRARFSVPLSCRRRCTACAMRVSCFTWSLLALIARRRSAGEILLSSAARDRKLLIRPLLGVRPSFRAGFLLVEPLGRPRFARGAFGGALPPTTFLWCQRTAVSLMPNFEARSFTRGASSAFAVSCSPISFRNSARFSLVSFGPAMGSTLRRMLIKMPNPTTHDMLCRVTGKQFVLAYNSRRLS